MKIFRTWNKFKTFILWRFYFQYKYFLYDDNCENKYTISQKIIMFINVTYTHLFKEYWRIEKFNKKIEYDRDKVSSLIYSLLNNNEPCMIARFGSIELNTVFNYLSIISTKRNIYNTIVGKSSYWWWNNRVRLDLKLNAGFFPNESWAVSKFCKMIVNDSQITDVLGTWVGKQFSRIKKDVSLVGLHEMEPWWQDKPWTRILRGKKVLVIHPFSELIESQYNNNRERLFKNNDILPLFRLRTVKSVQSIGGECDIFETWFNALEWMEFEINKEDFDIALIGCGAYGFPIAAYVKRLGKKSIHMGGVLQLLFGIKGSRWENKDYHPNYDYTQLFNEYWVRPGDKYKTRYSNVIENGCYW